MARKNKRAAGARHNKAPLIEEVSNSVAERNRLKEEISCQMLEFTREILGLATHTLTILALIGITIGFQCIFSYLTPHPSLMTDSHREAFEFVDDIAFWASCFSLGWLPIRQIFKVITGK